MASAANVEHRRAGDGPAVEMVCKN